MIRIEKSIYSPPGTSDRKRILVMTLWPRGVSKDKVDVWMKELGTPRDLIRRYKSGKMNRKKFANENTESSGGRKHSSGTGRRGRRRGPSPSCEQRKFRQGVIVPC